MKDFTLRKSILNGRMLFTAALAAAGLTAPAQSMRFLNTMTANDNTQFIATSEAISSNHKYVTGPAYNMETGGFGMFVYDLDTDEYAVTPEVDYYGADMRAVSDNGVAIGYNGVPLTYSIDGTTENLQVPENYTGTARDASDDLSVVVGCYYEVDGFYTKACIWRNGQMEELPLPTDEELGFETNGSSAYYITADGSIIVGYAIDNFSTNPVILWCLQDDGSYQCDPSLCMDYFSPDNDELDRPYIEFTPTGISRNGHYLGLNVAGYDGTERMARYDLTTGELEEFIPDGTNGIAEGSGSSSSAISDDGTICGWILQGEWVMQQRNACLWRGGEKYPVILADEYPELPDIARFDALMFNTLCDITPDGRYITGFAMDESHMYNSFVIDLGETATGISKTEAKADGNEEVARYTVDGTRISEPVKGLNIVKKADGTTVKVMVK